MMRRLLPTLALAGLAHAIHTAPAGAQNDRGRPVILLVHGRGMLDRDTALTRKLWYDGLTSGEATITRTPVITERDLRVVWYADVLDPRSSEGCDYAPTDPRAQRDAKTDADLKQVVSIGGALLNILSGLGGDRGSAGGSNIELRALAADASFLSDSRKRCGSEQRLSAAIDRARAEGRPIVVVGHSLGSLVAYDYLSTRSDTGVVQRFVTIGSMVGAPELRRVLIGGDSTDKFVVPPSVKDWVNIRNDHDNLATPMTIGRDVVTTPPADEKDPHEMVGYLRGAVTAREILGAWCGAFTSNRPGGCKEVSK